MSGKKETKPTTETTATPMGDADNTAETEKETTQDNQSQDSTANDFLSNPDIKAYIEKQISEGIQKALKGTPPKANTVDVSEAEKKQFEKMTYKERLNLFHSNPQAYRKLSKGDK